MAPDNKSDLIPSSFVERLFDQVKESSAHNTEAIKELTSAVNSLTQLLTAPPTHSEIHSKLKEHDNEIKIKDEKVVTEITKRFDCIEGKVDKVKYKMNTVLIVISVVFSLSMVAYLFVKNSIEYQIIDSVNKKTESIVTKSLENRNPLIQDLDSKLNDLNLKIDKLNKNNNTKR